MRCHICDCYLEQPKIDAKTGKVAPCSECWEAIQELLDKPSPFLGTRDPVPILSNDSIEYLKQQSSFELPIEVDYDNNESEV